MPREQRIIDKLRALPPERVEEVLDFVEFVEQRVQRERWISFDEWAMNLARKRGFNHLTEDDVAQIVKTHRRANLRNLGTSAT